MFRRALAAFALSSVAFAAHAQSGAPIRLVVPFPPGDALEASARTLAEFASAELGRPVVVENKPGAAGFIAAEQVARATDDATYLLGTTAMMTVTPYLRKAPYSPADFQPLARISTITAVFTVNNAVPAKTWQEFVALAKANPGKHTYATPGEGTILHLSMEMLQKETGLKFVQVPYKGMGPAMQDYLGGRIDIYTEPAIIAQVKGGNGRALAIMGPSRLPDLPDVPTLAELGVKFEAQPWIGVFAPKSASPRAVAEVEAAIQKAAARPEFRAKLPPGVQAAYVGRDAFGRQIEAEQASYRKVIADLNLKLD
jgi:tripartite-type tricarboxylate transporter receptor subunit TctC